MKEPDAKSVNEDELVQRRREQDLECLTLLRQAQELRMETEYVDSLFASLKDNEDENVDEDEDENEDADVDGNKDECMSPSGN